MQDQRSFFDVLVKTLKNEAKSLKQSYGLSHSKALDVVSKEYGFNHWNNICELKGYLVLSFMNDNIPVVNSTISNQLLDSSFSQIKSKAKIGKFIFKQRFDNSTLFDGCEFDTYLSKIREGLESLDDVKHFIRDELNLTEFSFIFKGQLYDQDILADEGEPYVTEYSYLGKEES